MQSFRRVHSTVCVVVLAAACIATASASQPVPHANLALDRPATSSPICKPGEEAGKAFNGRNTSWTHDKFCTLEKPAWLQVDLQQSRIVHGFKLLHAGAAGEAREMNTRAFRISTSLDGKAWKTAVEVRDNQDDVTSHDISPRKARYVRLDVTEPTQKASDPATRIYELEVH